MSDKGTLRIFVEGILRSADALGFSYSDLQSELLEARRRELAERRRAEGPANRRVTDAQITQALWDHRGDYRRAGAALGVSNTAVWLRVHRRPAIWPDGLPRRGPSGRRGRPRAVFDVDAVASALRASRGVLLHAARELGVNRITLRSYLARDGDAWPQEIQRPRWVPPPTRPLLDPIPPTDGANR